MGGMSGGGGGGMTLGPQTSIGTPDNPLSTWLRNFLQDPERQRMDRRHLEAIHALASGIVLTPGQWEALKSDTPTGEFIYGPGQPSRSGPTPMPFPVPPPVSIVDASTQGPTKKK